MTDEPKHPSQESHPDSTGGQGSSGNTEEVEPTPRQDGVQPAFSEKPARRRATANISKYEDFEGFVRYAYSRKGQAIKLTKKDATRLAECPMPAALFFEDELRTLTQTDRLMAVPAQLFLAGLSHRKTLPLWQKIERTYFAMLQKHPAAAGVLDLLQNARSAREPAWPALETVCDPKYVVSLPAVDSNGPLKQADAAKLQHNTIFNVVLWLTQLAAADLESVVRELYRHLWATEAASVRKDIDRLRILLKFTDRASAGLVASAFVVDAEEQRHMAEGATQREAEAVSKLVESQERVKTLEDRIESLASQVHSLNGQIRDNASQHDAALAHAIDDLERVRSRVIRRIEVEVDLLEEGLAALRRDPPKTHVMEDHAERAINGFRSELKSLSSGSNP